jgi:hypothetical protein
MVKILKKENTRRAANRIKYKRKVETEQDGKNIFVHLDLLIVKSQVQQGAFVNKIKKFVFCSSRQILSNKTAINCPS